MEKEYAEAIRKQEEETEAMRKQDEETEAIRKQDEVSIEGKVQGRSPIEKEFIGTYPEGPYATIGIKLSNDQMKSILNWKLDFNKIKNLQQPGQFPDIKNAGLGLGGNFASAILVGYRIYNIDEYKDVYLKENGWFQTPDGLQNCNPKSGTDGEPFFDAEKGYKFLDATAVGIEETTKYGVETMSNLGKNTRQSINAGLTGFAGFMHHPDDDKQGGTRKRKSNRKTNRKHKRKSSRKANRKASRKAIHRYRK